MIVFFFLSLSVSLQVIKDDMWPNPLPYFLAPDIEVEENGVRLVFVGILAEVFSSTLICRIGSLQTLKRYQLKKNLNI